MEERRTYRIDSVEGKEPLAVGYKIFNWDWTGQGDYCYADADGNVEGSVHTVTGTISACSWGLHFCKNPLDCLNFYGPQQWNKFAKVSAFDEIADADDGKSVCRTLRIDKVLTWDEYIEACKTVPIRMDQDVYGNANCAGVVDVSGGNDVYGGNHVYGGNYVWGGNYVYGGNYVSGGNHVRGGNHVYGGNYVWGGNDVYGGNYVWGGNDVSGGNHVRGGNDITYCSEVEGVSRCILCNKIEGKKLYIFNREATAQRFEAVKADITRLAGGWHPDFTNAEALREKSGGEWEATPAPMITGRTAKEAYADMPRALLDYIRSMPEYDAEIFDAITGGAFKEVAE